MKVEHVAGVGLTTRGTTQQQRHLSVGHSLLRKIVIDDEGVLATVTEEFTHGATGIRRKVLQRRSIRRSSRNDDRILHRIRVRQTLDKLGDGGSFLANSNVDADQLLLLICAFIETALVDDRINGDSGLASLLRKTLNYSTIASNLLKVRV